MSLGRFVSRAACFLLLSAPLAHAGRPLTVDDAAILDPNHCQIETWIDRTRDATAGWLVPSCNLALNTELQMGFARLHAEGESKFADAYAQAKFLLREMTDAEPWSVGMTVGFGRHPLNEHYRGWNNPYVVVPFSQKICNTPFLVHANLGWTRDRALQRETVLWGVAVEATASEQLTLVAEAFNDVLARPYVRLGGRWAMRDDFDIDLTWLTRPRGTSEERLISIGVTWRSAALN